MLKDTDHIEASCIFYVEVDTLDQLEQSIICVLTVTTWGIAHQQKMKWHSQYSEHFEIQVRLFSIMQCTLAGNILSKIIFISLRDFQTWYSIPKGV